MRGNRIVKDRTEKNRKTQEILNARRMEEEARASVAELERDRRAQSREEEARKRQTENRRNAVIEALGGMTMSGEEALTAEETQKLLDEIDKEMAEQN